MKTKIMEKALNQTTTEHIRVMNSMHGYLEIISRELIMTRLKEKHGVVTQKMIETEIDNHQEQIK